MNIPILLDVVIMLAGGFMAALLFKRVGIPKIIAYILAGIIVGPSALNLISNLNEIKLLAEIGVILLLFSIGLEFSIERLTRSKREIILGGSLQIIVTVLISFIISQFIGIAWNTAIFVGFLLAISSTAILLKMLQTRNQLGTDFGKRVVGILVFQDLAVIPMVLLIPILSGESKNFWDVAIQLLLTIFFLVVGVLIFRVISNTVFPKIIKYIDKELMIVGVGLLCFSLPLFAGYLNISLALGAFLAGLVISETTYKHKIFNSIEEFKDLFSCIFFVSLGLLFNLSFVFQNWLVLIVATIIVLIVNLLATTIALKTVHNWKQSLISAISLIQIGEFAFVLGKIGLGKNILSAQQYDLFVAVAIITMIATPYFLELSNHLETRFIRKAETGVK